MSDEGGTDPPPEDPPAEEGGDEAPAEDAGSAAGGSAAGSKAGSGGGEDGEKEEGGGSIADRIAKDPIELGFIVPLPETISFGNIPRINDSRSVWRAGMRKIEETFAEHIANMHIDFEDKAKEYEHIQYQLETNVSFLEQFYIDMQKYLNDKYAAIKVERDAWEKEKEDIAALVKLDSEVINIQIGGNLKIQTEKAILRQVEGSTMQKMFSDMHELKKTEEGDVFLDRDPKTFETLINYLRSDCRIFPTFDTTNDQNMFINELYHWGIDPHNRHWQEAYLNKLTNNAMKQIDSSIGQSYKMLANSPGGMGPGGINRDTGAPQDLWEAQKQSPLGVDPVMNPYQTTDAAATLEQRYATGEEAERYKNRFGAGGPTGAGIAGSSFPHTTNDGCLQTQTPQQLANQRPEPTVYTPIPASSNPYGQSNMVDQRGPSLDQQMMMPPLGQGEQNNQIPGHVIRQEPVQPQNHFQQTAMAQEHNAALAAQQRQAAAMNNQTFHANYVPRYDKFEYGGDHNANQPQFNLTQQQPPKGAEQQLEPMGDNAESGVALRAVKEKWSHLGPLKLEDIIANSQEPINQTLQFGQSKYNKYIIGQIGADGRVQGVGKEINHIIYEGQFKNDIYHGYGRYIYSNGNYYIGNWVDGKRSGWGKLVDKSGKTYEGMWQYSKFMGS